MLERLVVVGLGNPGIEYEGTRHNIGFDVIEELARRFKLSLAPGRGEFVEATREYNGRKFVLAEPLTYMNNSGNAVVELLEKHSASRKDLLVISDDFVLPLGTIRIREKGSDGGHNGLYSIIYQLDSNEFARVRCGIGQESMPAASETANFVLSPFDPQEKETVRKMIHKAADVVLTFAEYGPAQTMSRFNARL